MKYCQLRFFLLHCARSIEQLKQPMTDAEAEQIARDAKKFISMAMDYDTSPSDVLQTRSGTLTDLANARAVRLEEINHLSDLKLKALLALQEARITGEAVTYSTEPAGKEGHYFDMRCAENMAMSSTSGSKISTADGSVRQEVKNKNERRADILVKLAESYEREIHSHGNSLRILKDEQGEHDLANLADDPVRFSNVDKKWAKNLTEHIHHSIMSAYEENIREKMQALEEEASFIREVAKDIRELK